jgi:hypothetical protein
MNVQALEAELEVASNEMDRMDEELKSTKKSLVLSSLTL